MTTVSLGVNGLEMNVVGHLGECKILLPVKGNHVVSVELPPSTPTTARPYPLHALMESMSGLEIAEEIPQPFGFDRNYQCKG